MLEKSPTLPFLFPVMDIRAIARRQPLLGVLPSSFMYRVQSTPIPSSINLPPMHKLESHPSAALPAVISFPLRLCDPCLVKQACWRNCSLVGICWFCLVYLDCVWLHWRILRMKTRIKEASFYYTLKIKTSDNLHGIFTPQITVISDWEGLSECVSIWCWAWFPCFRVNFREFSHWSFCLSQLDWITFFHSKEYSWGLGVLVFFLPMSHIHFSTIRRIIEIWLKSLKRFPLHYQWWLVRTPKKIPK